MRALRAPVLVMGLVLLICTAAQSDASANKVEKTLRRIMEIMRQVENSADDESAQKTESAPEPKDTHHLKTASGETILEIFPRDLSRKEKFITILTGRRLSNPLRHQSCVFETSDLVVFHPSGPLYFGPKCKKDVYRLYHNTRDCTIPAHYKRCARLLTRLAGTRKCQEG
uniref:ALK and LTK ligand 2a n=1 Tax=Danio rerio TaxID=7955 RepID=AKL2A_DANRE|nr:RecName: Full=ALK and LTK ligand 2a; AltName: Full=Augmentor alpha-1; Short=AUG-alpha-1; Flags: Precursor [Danio rerio]